MQGSQNHPVSGQMPGFEDFARFLPGFHDFDKIIPFFC
jgi:hypothetical protein